MPYRRASRPGFTLIEVVFALTLLSFGLLSVAGGLVAISRMTTEGRTLSKVASLITGQVTRARIEGCRSNGWRIEGPYTIRWSGSPASDGRLVTIAVERLAVHGPRVDSLTWFQWCGAE
jgi:prepilin-type N-terminal cleavage/methylation domain-containing protein